MRGVETILFLVVLGTVVAAFAGRLRVPAPSLLVIAGLVVAQLPRFPPVHVPPDVVSLVVLPPLLYAASEELPWRDLRAVWRPVTVLAVGLVLASAAAVAAVTWAVAAVPVSMAFVLGAVLASTDPVAVSALGRRLSLPPRVQALVQAESLFNDATSLVLFQIAVSFAVAGTAGPAVAGGVLLHAAGQFAVLAAGGAAVGGVIAAGVIPVRRRVTDPVLETVLALVTPYAVFVLSEVMHVSPVMAMIVAGLAIGARRDRITTAQTRLPATTVPGRDRPAPAPYATARTACQAAGEAGPAACGASRYGTPSDRSRRRPCGSGLSGRQLADDDTRGCGAAGQRERGGSQLGQVAAVDGERGDRVGLALIDIQEAAVRAQPGVNRAGIGPAWPECWPAAG